MAYEVYEISPEDTLESIAKLYNTTVTELMTINNILSIESDIYALHREILVPVVGSGGDSFEDFKSNYLDMYIRNTTTARDQKRPLIVGLTNVIGSWAQGWCWLSVNGGGTCVFPCFPESYTDTRTANWTSQTPLGRSEPFQIYQNSGPREVSVSFRMHREMTQSTAIGDCVAIVQSATYPTGGDNIAPRVTLQIGRNCYITGIISNVSTNWGETINTGGQYNVVDLSFSVTECTGTPKTTGMVSGMGGR